MIGKGRRTLLTHKRIVPVPRDRWRFQKLIGRIQACIDLFLRRLGAVPAFQGIAMKLVPNSKPALDVPIIFPYAPNAVLLGFFVSFIVGTLSMFGMVALGTVVIIPGVVGHFFCGAAAAIYGNAKGGRRGAIIGAAVNSLLISWLPLFILPVLGNLSLASSTFADTDYLIPGIILGNIGALGETALLVGIIGFTVLVCLASKLMKEPEKA